MDDLPRIPFDERQSRSVTTLGRWMAVVAVAHGLGTIASVGLAALIAALAVARAQSSAVGAGLHALEAALALSLAGLLGVQCWSLLDARSSLDDANAASGRAQASLAGALRRLGHFFVLETIAFAVIAAMSFGGVAITFEHAGVFGPASSAQARDRRSVGQRVVDELRDARRRR